MYGMSEQIDATFRMLVPYILMFIMLVLGMVSFSTPLSTSIEIPFIFMMLYYWSLYRPSMMPPLLVFLVGICFDLLSGFPVGISSFVLIILNRVVSDQRLIIIEQPFLVVWLGYIVVSSVALFIQWALFGLLNFHWTPFMPVVLMIGAGSFLFPLIAFIFNLSNKLLPTLTDHYSVMK